MSSQPHWLHHFSSWLFNHQPVHWLVNHPPWFHRRNGSNSGSDGRWPSTLAKRCGLLPSSWLRSDPLAPFAGIFPTTFLSGWYLEPWNLPYKWISPINGGLGLENESYDFPFSWEWNNHPNYDSRVTVGSAPLWLSQTIDRILMIRIFHTVIIMISRYIITIILITTMNQHLQCHHFHHRRQNRLHP